VQYFNALALESNVENYLTRLNLHLSAGIATTRFFIEKPESFYETAMPEQFNWPASSNFPSSINNIGLGSNGVLTLNAATQYRNFSDEYAESFYNYVLLFERVFNSYVYRQYLLPLSHATQIYDVPTLQSLLTEAYMFYDSIQMLLKRTIDIAIVEDQYEASMLMVRNKTGFLEFGAELIRTDFSALKNYSKKTRKVMLSGVKMQHTVDGQTYIYDIEQVILSAVQRSRDLLYNQMLLIAARINKLNDPQAALTPDDFIYIEDPAKNVFLLYDPTATENNPDKVPVFREVSQNDIQSFISKYSGGDTPVYVEKEAPNYNYLVAAPKTLSNYQKAIVPTGGALSVSDYGFIYSKNPQEGKSPLAGLIAIAAAGLIIYSQAK
jgi:hypothetical protein